MIYVHKLSLKSCIPLIRSYQLSEDQSSFYILLAQFDLLLVNTIHQLTKRYKFLMSESFQELYHIAIVAFAQSLKKINLEEPEKIPATIKAYVVAAIKRDYRYKFHEVDIDYIDSFDQEKETQNVNKRIKRIDPEFSNFMKEMEVLRYLHMSGLSELEIECLHLKYWEKLKQKDIAKRLGITLGAVRYRRKHAIKLIRKTYVYKRRTKRKPRTNR